MDQAKTLLQSPKVVQFWPTSNFWLRGRPKHQVHRRAELPPKHQRRRCALTRLLHHCPIRPQDQRQMLVPVSLMLTGQDGKLSYQCAVEPLNQSITLRAERSGSSLLHPQSLAYLTEQSALKIPPLVTMKFIRHPEPGEHLIH